MTVGLIREGGRQVVQGAGAEGGDGADRAERPGIGQYGWRWQGRGRGGMSGERRGEQQRDEFHQHILINRMGHSLSVGLSRPRDRECLMQNSAFCMLPAQGALLWPVDYLAGVRADHVKAQAVINTVIGARATGAQDRLGAGGLIDTVVQ